MPDEACITLPGARYRGLENQLYRVEIHHSGPGSKGSEGETPKGPVPLRTEPIARTREKEQPYHGSATFKWSRENGSVVLPVRHISESTGGQLVVTVRDLGRDARFGLQKGDWVELADDNYVLENRETPLLRVLGVDPQTFRLTLEGRYLGAIDPSRHAL
jgi:hypothetical protein